MSGGDKAILSAPNLFHLWPNCEMAIARVGAAEIGFNSIISQHVLM